MDFTFSEEQRMMAASVRELLADVCSPAVLRGVAEGRDDARVAAERWARYRELGLPGLLAPEGAGGMGLTSVDFVLIAEEIGRAAVPEALIEHAAVAVPLLAEHSGDARVAPVLEAAAAGAARVAVALPQESLVTGAGQADWLLLGAGDELHLVPRSGVRLVEEPANDRLRRLHRVSYAPLAATRIVEGAGAREAMARAFDRGALHAAAQCLGVAERMLEIGVAYASERRQFGQVIGAYQGLKHQFASAQVRLEFARPVVYAAAASLADSGEKTRVAVSHAKLAAVAAADACARIAMQAHGAMGYSWEVDLHFYMKRAWALAGAWGDASLHARRVQSALWSGAQPLGPAHTFSATEA